MSRNKPNRHHADSPLPLPLKTLRWLDGMQPRTVIVSGILFILSIGGIGYATGPLLSTSLLYLIPLLVITRVAGLRAGIFSALLAGALWLGTDLLAMIDYTHPVTPYWNALMRIGTFLIAVSLVAATRSLNAHLEERVNERTAALEAKIAETQQLEKTILEIGDRERAAIGQDLHDGLCQQLVGAAFSANLLREKLTADPTSCTGDAEQIADLIDDSITQARNLSRGLYPVRLETEGLEMAVRELASNLAQRFGIPCHVQCPVPLPLLGESIGIHLYRIIQEAVTNAAKHSKARQIVIHLELEENALHVSVTDDGTGIKHAGLNPLGMGLNIMEYRARMIGADFEIKDNSSSGTRVSCVAKLKAES